MDCNDNLEVTKLISDAITALHPVNGDLNAETTNYSVYTNHIQWLLNLCIN
jgi:hypothetical protein